MEIDNIVELYFELKNLIKEIEEVYGFLYDYNIDYSEFIDKGDRLLKDAEYKEVIEAINSMRHDLFTSDREVASLYLVLRKYKGGKIYED